MGHGGDGDRNQDLTLVTLRVSSEMRGLGLSGFHLNDLPREILRMMYLIIYCFSVSVYNV